MSSVQQLTKDLGRLSVLYLQRTESLLEQLPVEVVLCICDFLEIENRRLLSLSCKSLYKTLNAFQDLRIDDADVRVRFSQLLDFDYPRHVTCRTCGFLYKWQPTGIRGYACPYRKYHRQLENSSAGRPRHVRDLKMIHMNKQIRREKIDLVWRAQQLGLRFGVRAASLNATCDLQFDTRREDECRCVDGQVMICSTWTITPVWDKPFGFSVALNQIQTSLCLHTFINGLNSDWPVLEERLHKMTTGIEQSPVKCPYCAFESRMYRDGPASDPNTVTVKGWFNFGNRAKPTLETSQVFCLRPTIEPVDAETLAARDLQALFESGAKD